MKKQEEKTRLVPLPLFKLGAGSFSILRNHLRRQKHEFRTRRPKFSRICIEPLFEICVSRPHPAALGDGFNQQFVYSFSIHVHNFKQMTACVKSVAGLRHPIEFEHRHAADRLDIGTLLPRLKK